MSRYLSSRMRAFWSASLSLRSVMRDWDSSFRSAARSFLSDARSLLDAVAVALVPVVVEGADEEEELPLPVLATVVDFPVVEGVDEVEELPLPVLATLVDFPVVEEVDEVEVEELPLPALAVVVVVPEVPGEVVEEEEEAGLSDFMSETFFEMSDAKTF